MRVSIPALLLAAAASSAVQAAEGVTASEYWFAGEGGLAAVHQSFTGGAANSTRFAMALGGGYVASPQLRLGLELGGILLEASDVNDPSRGRGISQVFGVAQFQTSAERDSPYLKVALGYVSYWGQHGGDTHRSGWGGSVAIGKGLWKTDYGHFGPVLSLAGGRAGGVEYRAVSLGLSWSTP